jgi:hypothetical protein
MDWTDFNDEFTSILEQAAENEDLGAVFSAELGIQGMESEVSISGEWFSSEEGPFLELQLQGFDAVSLSDKLQAIGWTGQDSTFVYKITWDENSISSIWQIMPATFEAMSLTPEEVNIEFISLSGLDDY